jgi:TolA-binding protein
MWAAQVPVCRAQQLPDAYAPAQFYETGLELLSRAKYEAAQEQFRQFIALEGSPLWTPADAARVADAYWNRALCAYHLLKLEAESLFQEFADRFPAHSKVGYAFFHRARLAFLKRSYDTALAYVEQIPRGSLARPDQQEAQFMQGYCYFQQGRKQEAATTLRPLTQTTGPLHDRANYYYALVQYDLENYDEALRCFRDIDQAEDYKLKVPVYVAGILLHKQKYAELLTYGQRLLEADGEYDQKPLIFQQVGTACFALRKYPEALKYLRAGEAATTAPSRELRYLLGMALYYQERYPEAVRYLEPVAEGTDTVAQGSSYFLGFAYLEAGRKEDARFAFRRAYSLDLQPVYKQDGLFQYAKLSFQQRFYADAVSSFREYLEKYPNAHNANEVRGLVGEALYYSNNLAEAIGYFTASGLRDPRTQRAYQRACLYYGLSLFERNRLDSAEIFLNRACQANHDPRARQTAEFWYGEILYVRGRYLEAARAYNNFLTSPNAERHPNYAEGLLGLGWSHLQQNHRESAERSFRIAANLPGLRQSNPTAYEEANLRMGDIEFLKRNYPQAEHFYTRALEANGRGADYALFQLGATAHRQERYPTAIQRWKQLVANHPTSGLRDDALLELSKVYFNFQHDASNSRAYAQQLLQQHPNSPLAPNAILNLGIAARDQNDNPEATRQFRRLLREYPGEADLAPLALEQLRSLLAPDDFGTVLSDFRRANPNATQALEGISFTAARELFYQEKYAAAIQQFDTYLNDYPNGPNRFEALTLRGEAKLKTNDPDGALRDFAAVYDAPNGGENVSRALMGAATVLESQNKLQQAMDLLARAETAAALPTDRQRAKMARGDLANRTQQHPLALQIFRELVADPAVTEYSRILARVQLGKSFYFTNQKDSALATLREVAAENANAPGAEAQHWVVRILFEKDQYDDCLAALQQMRDRFRSYPVWLAESFLYVAEVYVKQNKRLNAMETLKSIRTNAPNDDIRARATRRLQELEAQAPPNNPPPRKAATAAGETSRPAGWWA